MSLSCLLTIHTSRPPSTPAAALIRECVARTRCLALGGARSQSAPFPVAIPPWGGSPRRPPPRFSRPHRSAAPPRWRPRHDSRVVAVAPPHPAGDRGNPTTSPANLSASVANQIMSPARPECVHRRPKNVRSRRSDPAYVRPPPAAAARRKLLALTFGFW